MNLQELKQKSPSELITQAEKLGIENPSTLRKQEILFSILNDHQFINLYVNGNISNNNDNNNDLQDCDIVMAHVYPKAHNKNSHSKLSFPSFISVYWLMKI